MTWLTWRIERGKVLVGAALVLVAAAVLLTMSVNGPVAMTSARVAVTIGPPAFAVVVAVFWGAPLVAREYEQRTYLLLWSRERPATRWLALRVAHLLLPLVALTFVVTMVAQLTLHRMNATTTGFQPAPDYDLWPPMQLATVLAGFALGVLVGVLVRNVVVSMGITLVGYAALRLFVGVIARPHLLPPLRLIDKVRPVGSMFVSGGYLDRDGQELSVAAVQALCTGQHPVVAAQDQCLVAHGIAHAYVDIQPVSRLTDLRLVEFGGYAVLAVVLFAAAWLMLRRREASR
ncbi:hypothetical protein [Kutzneria kofuensis]|uniref:ABC-2 family transporter n=1 Tax=Kutzneria kofuensis TaxID=103725 RepID=A0A7W9KJ36_9PSEU|nr:hypothetical protein [Kutzneria kofuensis]MBB5893521.1 hypothetical protein [Kutzneria kofuensis]